MYSTDENLLHTSYEGGVLEDPSIEAPESVWQRTVNIMDTPDTKTEVKIDFRNGDPVAVDGQSLNSSEILSLLKRHGR